MKINAKHFEKLSKLKRALCGPSVLELARFTGEPSIHQNDAAIYSWTSIKCQKFFSISIPFSIRFSFSVSVASVRPTSNVMQPNRVWHLRSGNGSSGGSVDRVCSRLCQRHRPPCHAPSVFGSQCGSQKVAHPLRRRHVSTLFACRHAPIGKWSSTGLPCVV